MDTEGESFVEAISRLPGLWRSIDIRVLSLRIAGDWHNLATNCLLDSKPVDEVPRYLDLPVTPYFRAWQVILGVEALDKILDQVGNGLLELDDGKVHYVRLQPSDERRAYGSGNHLFLGLSGGQARTPRAWACHRLIEAGDSAESLLGQLSVRAS
ncbi:MAG TPA: hypothetical protein VJP78_01265, partial [Thermoleophilia bacterium]|nr:hypothetical protein [Thermoleophilia bacterium]